MTSSVYKICTVAYTFKAIHISYIYIPLLTTTNSDAIHLDNSSKRLAYKHTGGSFVLSEILKYD